MVNPFDNNFFKFLIGFTLILIMSFALIYVIGHYDETTTASKAIITKLK